MGITSYPDSDDFRYLTPGVYFEETAPKETPEFQTGVAAFLGLFQPWKLNQDLDTDRFPHSYVLTGWEQFGEQIGESNPETFLGHAVKGFFTNGGERCVVVLPSDGHPAELMGRSERVRAALQRGLELLENREDVDLICVPDLCLAEAGMIELQREVLEHCERMRDRFAILDSIPSAGVDFAPGKAAREQDIRGMLRHWQELLPTDGAVYFPWIRVPGGPLSTRGLVPPCGHVAGVYARVDSRVGVHKAPANEIVEGAVDLEVQLTDQDQSELNNVGVNCLRALPGRGIRVWGARTLSGLPDWRYVNVRRLFLTLVRWIDYAFQDVVFEPNTPSLWEQIRGRLNGFCFSLFQAGALKGLSVEDAFYVKCDAETNRLGEREDGRVISHVGLAPVVPAEFIVVRIAHSAAGTTFTGPTGPELERR